MILARRCASLLNSLHHHHHFSILKAFHLIFSRADLKSGCSSPLILRSREMSKARAYYSDDETDLIIKKGISRGSISRPRSTRIRKTSAMLK